MRMSVVLLWCHFFKVGRCFHEKVGGQFGFGVYTCALNATA